jgi:UDP-N-acetylmuramoyl-tripeptide--D-alanyl-D-alanine ligase
MLDLQNSILLLGLLFFFLKALDFIYLFQTKEYRFDRLFSHLKEEGWLKVFILRSFRLPAKSIRNIILAGFSFFAVVGFFYILQLFSIKEILVFAAFFPLTSFFVVTSSVLATGVLAERKRQRIINQAAALRKDCPGIFIGITGSYGKTSIKEFLSQILSHKYRVAKTEANMNTEVGVALSIVKNLNVNTQFFIAELGAYKKGEIAAAANVIKPKYAILTGIGNQHLDLFGSRDNLVAAKSELLKAIPPDGRIYINKDIEGYEKIIAGLKPSICLYSSSAPADIYSTHITKSNADIVYHNGHFRIETQLLGKHNIINLLPCIALASDLGMTTDEITNAIKKINPVKGKLSLHPGFGSSTVIDDSHNANVEGFIAALETAAAFPQKKKVIVSKGIIELGTEKESSYKRMMETLMNTDFVLYTTDELFEKLDPKNKVILFHNEESLLKHLFPMLDSNVLLVIEGKFPISFVNKLII